MSQVNQLTVKQHLAAASNSATWAAHIPALESFLAEKRPDFYLNYTCASLSDLLCRFSWIEAPAASTCGSRYLQSNTRKITATGGRTELSVFFNPAALNNMEQITSLDLIGA